MKRLDMLKQLDDDQLFKIGCYLPVEYQARIIKLLEKHNITQYTFTFNVDDCPITTIFNDYEKTEEITVVSVGYSIDMMGNTKLSDKNLYLIDKNDKFYSGEDCILHDTLWDVYKALKDSLK